MEVDERKSRLDDEDELFGRQVAATLCRFSNKQKAHVKVRMQTVLLDTEFPEEPVPS